MWELDCEKSWVPKNWCFWTVVMEKTLESPLDSKEIQPVHPQGDQSWVFIGRTDAEAETPVLWPPHAKSWLIGKDPDAGRDWGQEEKGKTEDKMAGWHHLLDGQEFGWTPGDGDGQGVLACCNSWGHKELDTTEWLNWSSHNKETRQRSVVDPGSLALEPVLYTSTTLVLYTSALVLIIMSTLDPLIIEIRKYKARLCRTEAHCIHLFPPLRA